MATQKKTPKVNPVPVVGASTVLKEPVNPGITVGGITTGADVAGAESALQAANASKYGFWHQDDGNKIDPSRPVWQQTLSGFLNEALKQGWIKNSASFESNFKQTDWFKQNGNQAVLAANTKFTNPQQWATDTANRSQQIKSAATAMGYTIDDATASGIAETSLYSAYDSNAFDNPGYQKILQGKITTTLTAQKQVPTGGAAVDNTTALKDYARSMAISHDASWYDNAANQINDPASGLSLNSFKNQIKDDSKLNWGAYADKIDKGFSVSDIVAPYTNAMSRLLEINPNAIDPSTDPYIKKAAGLTVGTDGTSQPMPVWQFENLLRQDPKWLKTNNARDSVMSTGMEFLKSYGLVN
jgi:hypothetical protein